MHTGFWWRNLKHRDHVEDHDIDKWTILTWILVKYDGRVWTGLIWLRIERIIEPA
jgi:hypothetical protein